MWGTIRGDHGVTSPFGKPGDRLWVRETFSVTGDAITYRASVDGSTQSAKGWKPAIHMPRTACRLAVDVMDVEIERLQDITSDDAVAEGIEPHDSGDAAEEDAFNRSAYAELWDSLNAKRGFSWKRNPWVWVVTFMRDETFKAAA